MSFQRERSTDSHGGAGQDHLQDGRDAVREGDPLGGDQLEDHRRLVHARVDLLDPEQGRDVRDAPGVHVEHGGERHVDVVRAHAHLGVVGPDRDGHGQRVQHELAVGEVDPLGVAGRAGGVEGGRARVLVEVREGEARGGPGEQRLVLGREGERAGRRFGRVVDQDQRLDRGQLVAHGLQQREEVRIDEHDLRPGVVERVDDLLGREPPVDGLQRGAHAGDGEEALEVAVAVELHRGHDVAGGDPQAGEPVREPADPLVQRAVGDAGAVAVDDLALGGVRERRAEQLLQDQGVRIGLSRSVRLLRHDASLWVDVRLPLRFPHGLDFKGMGFL